MADPLSDIGSLRRDPDAAVDYLTELLDSAAILALAVDLPNSSAFLTACAKLVHQEHVTPAGVAETGDEA